MEETQKPLTVSARRYLTIKQWLAEYGYIPLGGLRHLIFKSKSFNDKVVKRIGSKIILDVLALDEWIEEQNKEQKQINTGK